MTTILLVLVGMVVDGSSVTLPDSDVVDTGRDAECAYYGDIEGSSECPSVDSQVDSKEVR